MKAVFLIVMMLAMVGSAGAETLFQENFNTNTKGNLTSCDAGTSFSGGWLRWGNGNSDLYCYADIGIGAIPADFKVQYDIDFSQSTPKYSYWWSVYSDDATFTVYFDNTDVDAMGYGYPHILVFYPSTGEGTLDVSVNLNSYAVAGKVTITTIVAGNNISFFGNGHNIGTFPISELVSWTYDSIEIAGWTNDGEARVDNILISDGIYGLSGYVKGFAGIPLSGATVTISNTSASLSVTSDVQGWYDATAFSVGMNTYTVSKSNYSVVGPGAHYAEQYGLPLNFSLTAQYIARAPSIAFDANSYVTDDVMVISVYASSAGTVTLVDSKGIQKYTTTISAQETKTISYIIRSTDNAGIWRANLKSASGSVVVYANAEVNVVPAPVAVVPDNRNWTLPDVFMWLRIYIPWITLGIGFIYVISLTGSFYQILTGKPPRRARR